MVTTEEPVAGYRRTDRNELGHPELNALVGWSGIAGPKGLPEEVKTKWGEWLSRSARTSSFWRRPVSSAPCRCR